MSNFNCTNSSINSGLGAANQLRFITLCQNGKIQSAPQTNLSGASIQAPVNAGISGQDNTTPKYQQTLQKDTTDFSDKYAADDGKISVKDKAINFGKGVISPVTTMFSSPKRFIAGAAGIIGGGLLIAATGGAAAPVMVAAGVAGGAIGLIKNGFSAMNAKTDEEAKKAWQGLGLSTGITLGSIAGSKSALKGAGIETNGLNHFSATVECFKTMPSQVGKSVNAFTSGKALVNIKNALHIKNKDTKTADDKTTVKDTTENKAPENTKTDLQAEKPVSTEEITKPVDTPETIIEEGNLGVENVEDANIIKQTDIKKTKKPPKPRRRRQSRIKHNVSKQQAQNVKKEVKTIGQILDDIVEHNDVDTQFKQTVENLKEIAQNPMEQPKYDEKSLISAIKHLEGHRDNTKADPAFDDAISYIEKILSKEYKIDRLQAKAGDVFDDKIMCSPFENEHTNDPALDNTVFKMLFSGFKRQSSDRVPRGWKISVIKYTKE